MKKAGIFLVLITCFFLIGISKVNAAVPLDDTNIMYAKYYEAGAEVVVSLPAANVARLNPANALGMFDAIQGTGANEKFFAVASREYTNYWFNYRYWNIDGEADITFSEVTWGTTWHAEAVKVYLTDAYVRNSSGKIVPYTPKIGEGDGYYAGIAWNKIGINGLNATVRNNIAKSYLPGVTRDYMANHYHVDGNFGLTHFHLPDEVVYAKGIILVDITKDVYNLAGGGSTYNGNTDGYDLDGISVYRYIPLKGESATGYGTRIVERGTWFMYNQYDPQGTNVFNIQMGNPKEGENFVGTYKIDKDGLMYTATYDMDDTYIANGYEYDIYVKNSHLAISDNLFTSTAPGKLANEEFGIPFMGYNPNFYIFAHFEIEFR
jgi:hypothetical protein